MKKFIAVILMLVCSLTTITVNAETAADTKLTAVNAPDYELVNTGFVYSRDYVTDDEMYSIQLKATNNTSSNVRCDVFAAVYDQNNGLKAATCQEQIIFHDSSNRLIFNIASNFSIGGKGETIKVFLWEHGTLRPLSDALEFRTDESYGS